MLHDTQPQQEILEQRITKSTGQIVIRTYAKRQLLGIGGFARCYKGYHIESKKLVAIKVVEKHSLTKNRAKQKLLSQIKIHKALHHRHIVQFDSVFEDSNRVYMILELCENKTLSEMVKKRKKLTQKETRYFMLQLLNALQYMHENRVIHRDLKMGNIFINTEMEIKVGDFGLATKLEFIEEKKRTMCGTPNYIAPEIVEGAVGHSYEVDIWSTGVICYALLFGRPPFQTSEVKATYKRIKSCEYTFPSIPMSQDAKAFISNILILDPKQRLTVKEMLEHPFLNSEDIPRILPVEALKTIPDFGNEATTLNENEEIEKYRTTAFTKYKQSELNENRKIKFSSKDKDYVRQPLQSPRNGLNEQPRTSNGPAEVGQIDSAQHRINVLAFVDYSTKYGLGYLINNKTYGVYFNDSSLMSLDSEKKRIIYIDNPSSKDEKMATYQSENKDKLPKDRNFQKKYLLLEKFIYQLDQEAQKADNHKRTVRPGADTDFIYMKQWLKTKHAIMFRLSNKIFQVNFLDMSQILLNTETKTVLFTSKKGTQIYEYLYKALQEKDTEMSRRIKYTKQILNSIKKGKEDENQQK